MAFGAVFSFASWLYITVLLICSASYVHTCYLDPDCSLLGSAYSKAGEDSRHGVRGIVFKLARVGERCSLVVSVAFVALAVHTLLF